MRCSRPAGSSAKVAFSERFNRRTPVSGGIPQRGRLSATMRSRSSTTSAAYSPLMGSGIFGQRRRSDARTQAHQRDRGDDPDEGHIGPEVVGKLGHWIEVPVEHPEKQDRPQGAPGRQGKRPVAPPFPLPAPPHGDKTENDP